MPAMGGAGRHHALNVPRLGRFANYRDRHASVGPALCTKAPNPLRSYGAIRSRRLSPFDAPKEPNGLRTGGKSGDRLKGQAEDWEIADGDLYTARPE